MTVGFANGDRRGREKDGMSQIGLRFELLMGYDAQARKTAYLIFSNLILKKIYFFFFFFF